MATVKAVQAGATGPSMGDVIGLLQNVQKGLDEMRTEVRREMGEIKDELTDVKEAAAVSAVHLGGLISPPGVEARMKKDFEDRLAHKDANQQQALMNVQRILEAGQQNVRLELEKKVDAGQQRLEELNRNLESNRAEQRQQHEDNKTSAKETAEDLKRLTGNMKAIFGGLILLQVLVPIVLWLLSHQK